jgi:hypothetical protein
MATAVKTLRTIIAAATSNAAAGTTTGTTVNLTTALGGLLHGKITNGGTGPTVAANFTVQISGDNSTWKTYIVQPAGAVASTSYEFFVEIHAAVMYVRVVVDANTAQAVTCEAFLQELTSIG